MSSTAVKSKPGSLRITIQSGTKRGQTLAFQKSLITIGRGAENDIVLPDDSKLSRRHVEIECTQERTVIRNASSKNSLLIEGVEQTNFTLVSPTEILVGETKILLSPPMQKLEHSQLQQLRVVPSSDVKASASGLTATNNSFGQQMPTPRDLNSNVATNSPPSAPRSAQPRTEPKPKMNLGKPGGAPGADKARFRFVVILILVGAVGIWLFTDSTNSKKSGPAAVRTDDVAIMDLQKSESIMRELEKKQEERGQQSIQYKMAQENYIKGFRDYRQGQYGRAISSFQAALSFYPQHQLASKYLTLSKRKFDEKVQIHMLQGQRYRGKNNYRLCKSSFASVMIMVKDPNDTIYREAKQYYNECSLLMEGRF